MALATDWLDDRDPVSLAVLGAYFAVGDARDPEQARRLWRQATVRGVDLLDLPRVLEDTGLR
jgi:hypothetical protein